MRARQSATCGLGAQARAGLCPSSSSASKLAPLAMSSCTTGTRPFLADKCKGLWEQEIEKFGSRTCALDFRYCATQGEGGRGAGGGEGRSLLFIDLKTHVLHTIGDSNYDDLEDS